MKLSLSTNWCNRRIESGEEIAEKAIELGFDELELGFHTSLAQVEGFRKTRVRIPVGSVHAFCPVPVSAPQGYPELYSLASFSREARELARVHVLNNIRFAADVGADTVVLHAGRVTFNSLFRFIDSSLLRETLKACGDKTDAPKYAKLLARAKRIRATNGERLLGLFKDEVAALVPELEKLGVTLAFENLPYLEGFPDEKETVSLLDDFKDAPVKAWFDTGHDRVRVCHGWTEPDTWKGGDDEPCRYAGLHLNDVKDFTDDHLAPGFGKVDFAALAPLAGKVRHIVFEPSQGVSEEDLKKGLAKIRSLWYNT